MKKCFIIGDVAYGACCIDDFTSIVLGCDFLVHYGHSCLVPISITNIRCLYIFVTIEFNVLKLCKTLETNFSDLNQLQLAGTIQFSKSIQVGISFDFFKLCYRI